MAITDVKGRERAPLRWIALLLAATTLSGCVASALDSTISFAPDANSAYSGENDEMVTVPRPSEDLAEFAAEEAAGGTEEPVDALAAMPPENANPDPDQTEEILSPQTEMMAAALPADEPVTEGVNPETAAGEEVPAGTDEGENSEVDAATARINAAGAPAPADG